MRSLCQSYSPNATSPTSPPIRNEQPPSTKIPRGGRLRNSPKYTRWIHHTGGERPAFVLRRHRLDAIARWKVKAHDVIPPCPHISDSHVHHKIIGPLLHVVVLQHERVVPD